MKKSQCYKKIGPYQLLREIGSGSFARVYRSHCETDGQDYAIKMISKNILSEENKQMIDKEIQILLDLNHPNIIKLHDFKKTSNNWYLVFEYCELGDLEHYMKKYYKGRFPEKDAQKIIRQISLAFVEMRQRKIVHRDLKLANILVNKDFVVKMADFGFAKYTDESSYFQSYCGTPITMGPEVLKREKYNEKCDIWSLGVIIYQMLFGVPPFCPKKGGTVVDLIKLIDVGKLEFPTFQGEKPISESVKDLIKLSLVADPDKRINFEQFFQHPWIGTNVNATAAEKEEVSTLLQSVFTQLSPPSEPQEVPNQDQFKTSNEIQDESNGKKIIKAISQVNSEEAFNSDQIKQNSKVKSDQQLKSELQHIEEIKVDLQQQQFDDRVTTIRKETNQDIINVLQSKDLTYDLSSYVCFQIQSQLTSFKNYIEDFLQLVDKIDRYTSKEFAIINIIYFLKKIQSAIECNIELNIDLYQQQQDQNLNQDLLLKGNNIQMSKQINKSVKFEFPNHQKKEYLNVVKQLYQTFLQSKLEFNDEMKTILNQLLYKQFLQYMNNAILKELTSPFEEVLMQYDFCIELTRFLKKNLFFHNMFQVTLKLQQYQYITANINSDMIFTSVSDFIQNSENQVEKTTKSVNFQELGQVFSIQDKSNLCDNYELLSNKDLDHLELIFQKRIEEIKQKNQQPKQQQLQNQ